MDEANSLREINENLERIANLLAAFVENPQDQLWTVDDIARYCQRSTPWVYAQMKNEDFPLDCDNTPHRYNQDAIRAYFGTSTPGE